MLLSSKHWFNRQILSWFAKAGRHDLPWQHNPTAYRVWISEVMLQQTQVQTVIPYFQNFIRQFPNLKQLALASEDRVLHAWSGLGYYARARNLHKTAQIIYRDYHGRFPQQREILSSLPGIGRSTAAAICALSFQQAEPILDGNVKRILARFAQVPHPIESSQGLKMLWQLAEQLMPSTHCADYTQALMDLGALICTRSLPRCQQCPLRTHCASYQSGSTADYPVAKPNKTILPTRYTHCLIIKNSTPAVLLQKRERAGIWGGLWCFPLFENAALLQQYCRSFPGFKPAQLEAWPSFRHTFTHFHLVITPLIYHLPAKSIAAINMSDPCWVSLADPQYPGGIPKPVTLLMTALEEYYVANNTLR